MSEWVISPDELRLRKALYKLGYQCQSSPAGSITGFAHVITDITTGKVKIASIYPDIYRDVAISETIKMVESQGQR